MVSFRIILEIPYGAIRGCDALDLCRRLKLQETTYMCSMGRDHHVGFDVDEAFARIWFPSEDLCNAIIPTQYLVPEDVRMICTVSHQYQIRLNENMTLERAKELFIASQKERDKNG